MKSEVKKLWCDALRSNEYQQTKGRLKDEVGYCCLGVLCELYKRETGNGEWKDHTFYGSNITCLTFTVDRESNPFVLPTQVTEWADLDSANPEVDNVHIHCNRLSHFNDFQMSFAQIADLIEEKL